MRLSVLKTYFLAQILQCLWFPSTSLSGVSEFGIEIVLRIDHEVLAPVGLQHNILSDEELASYFSRSNGIFIYSGDPQVPGMQIKYGDRNSVSNYDRRDYLLDVVRKQVDYLYGVFQDPSFLNSVDHELGLKGDDRMKNDLGFGGLGENSKVRIYIKQVTTHETLIAYTYSVRAIVNRKILQAMEKQIQTHGDPSVEITVTLPNRVEEELIYPKDLHGKPILKMCTDPHYTEFGDYWYFFKPFDSKCKAKLLTPKYRKIYDPNVKIHLRPLNEKEIREKESSIVYPEYSELYEHDELRIDAFIGYDEVDWGQQINRDSTKTLDAKHKKDVAALDFEESFLFLKNQGFRMDAQRSLRAFTYGYYTPYGDKSFLEIEPSVSYQALPDQEELDSIEEIQSRLPTFSGVNHSITLVKTLEPQTVFGKKRTIRVRLHLVDTSITSPDTTFTFLWKEALEHSHLIFYGGHSGLGGNLNISNLNERNLELSLSPLNMPKETYQVIFFNGCSTYGYYNRQYFQQKTIRKSSRSSHTSIYVPGTKMLDIINTGLQSDFARTLGNLWAFIKPFANYETASFNEILRSLENSNGSEKVQLILNGEQDNPQDLDSFCQMGLNLPGVCTY